MSTLIYSGGKITTVSDRERSYPEILLTPAGVSGLHNGNTIRISSMCDQEDAAIWIASYLNVCHSSRAGDIIDSFYGVTYELGGHHHDPSVEAVAAGNTIRFYSVPTLKSLFYVRGTPFDEDASRHVAVETFIMRQCARLLALRILSLLAPLSLDEVSDFILDDLFFEKNLNNPWLPIISEAIQSVCEEIKVLHTFPPSDVLPGCRIKF